MFLACTADDNYWNRDQPILFLGEWCRLHAQRQVWSVLAHEVLPYHWDDRRRLHRDYLYVRDLARRCLRELTASLNQLHGLRESERFWDLLFGKWLGDFIGICLDRYLSIVAAAETQKVKGCLIPAGTHAQHAAKDLAGAARSYCTTDFNGWLYGHFISRLALIPFKELPAPPPREVDRQRGGALRPFLKDCYRAIYRAAPASMKQTVLVDTDFPRPALLRLCESLRQLPALIAEMPSDPPLYDEARRCEVKLSLSGNDFEYLLNDLIPAQLPRTVVEGFPALARLAESAYSPSARFILTGNAHISNDLFKLWAARRVASGATLVVHQHGGNYGSAAFSGTEDYESAVADRFFSWGWTDADKPKVQPMPAAGLVDVSRRLRPKPDGDILVGSNSVPLQFYRFAAMPIGPQNLQFVDGHVRFFRNLSPEAYSLSVLRLYPIDFGWNEAARYSEAFPDLRVLDSVEDFYTQLNRSRLFVSTSNQTTYLESLAANFPTILFWDRELWELRPEAAPYFDLLKAARVLHDTPESAAAFVSQIAHAPASWWHQPDVQHARHQFCDRFARVSGGWLAAWKGQLACCSESVRER